MSKTFRRKGYKAKQGRVRGGKTAGFYTVMEGWWYRHSKEPVSFREPTRQEYFEEYWKIHGDNHSKQWSPSWWHRHNRIVQNRNINKQELSKWLKDADYEPLFEADPRDCKWDWS